MSVQLTRTTIEEVAARAGVSAGTVSRVLNGKNKENRPAIAKRSERIRRIAKKLGYRPNAAARSIVTGQFGTVGFVTAGDAGTDWYPISALNGIYAAITASHRRLLFNQIPAKLFSDPDVVPHLFRESTVDGLIVNLLPRFSDSLVPYFESQPAPCVWINLKLAERSVYPDDTTAAPIALEYLFERGHRKIGFLQRQFETNVHYSVNDRLAGFCTAMRKAGLSDARHLPLHGDSPDELATVMDRAEEFLRRYPDTTAAICYEMEEAVCLHTAALRARKLPGNFEIVGISHDFIRYVTGLPIPTVRIPFYEVGERASEMLIEMLTSGKRNVPSKPVAFSDPVDHRGC
ncbi:MAG: LacI family DNA-binding transcriptional regulator [Phycisphaerae bacterium]